MASHETGVLARAWPVWLVSLLGLWPLADSIEGRISQIDLPDPAMQPETLILASLLQTALLLLLATVLGAVLAPRLGLISYLAERRGVGAFIRELPLAITLGVVLGGSLLCLDRWVFQTISPALGTPAASAAESAEHALLLGMLYGGISEEVLMRWGLMSLVCGAVMHLWGKRQARMPRWIAWTGILLSAAVFAFGHLPAALLGGPLDFLQGARILGLNLLAGMVFGWLYWRRSLEAACVAHAAVHGCFYGLSGHGWGGA
ncbi:MAG: type II CAAX prenyl endopeptidase Rce1 family protein [Pseudomonadota bacterium]